MSSKAELRQSLKSQRGQLSPSEITARSQQIQQRLLELPEVVNAESYFVYVSCRTEASTQELLRAWLAAGRMVVVPKTVDATTMEAHRLTDFGQLAPGPFGVPTPIGTEPYLGRLDVCLAPGLAFTIHGDRLGYGKGHYDRFLASHPEMLTIGLAYEFQIVSNLYAEPDDRPMDVIVTDERVIRVNRKTE